MELSPKLYHKIVRPRWTTKKFIYNTLRNYIDFEDKNTLDFGCGIGSCSCIFPPSRYIGVDPDAKRIAYAKKLYTEHKFYHLRDLLLPADNESIDNILVIAVIHHISSKNIMHYFKEFNRVLKPEEKIVIIEPCLFKNSYFNNWFMKFFDRGKHIRDDEQYYNIFKKNNYKVRLIKKYKQMMFYNKIFFLAEKI